MAKNKVKVEYDVDMEKERRKKQQKNGKPGFAIRRSNILLYGLLLVVEVLFYYFLTPAINVHTSGFWTWVILTLAAIGFCSFDFKGTRITKKGNIKEAVGSTKVVMVSFTAILVLIVGLIIGGLASSQLFRASKYAGIIKVEDGDFATDVPESENINNIALMDTDSARIIGDRSIGSLSDVVSQYQVSETYSTIDYNGVPMKVAPLEYAGFIKYLKLLVQGRIFSLDFFRSHWVFIASVVFLFWLSIANRYVCQTKVETIKDLRFELSNAKTERVRATARYMGLVRHSRIIALVNENKLGLEIPDTPPVKLIPQDGDKE